MTGELLALLGAAAFGAGNVSARMGMRTSATDNGMFMTVIINLITTVPWAIAHTLTSPHLPPLSMRIVLLFVAAGSLTTLLGRWSLFASIRRIGPGRTGVYKITSPVFASLFALAILRESLDIWAMAGVLIVLVSLWYFSVQIGRSYSSQAESAAAGELGRVGSNQLGIGLSLLSAASFGLGHVFRKIGLEAFPSAPFGAAIGSSVSMTVILALTIKEGRLRQLIRENFHKLPVYFVASGVFTTMGMILQFLALLSAPVTIVTILTATEGLFTIFLGALFIGSEERITFPLFLSAVTTTLGVAIIILYG